MTYNPENDGIDHINIYSKGKTDIGRFLSNFSKFKFSCEDGEFLSIEGYWYWLSVNDDRLRKVYGFEAKKLGRELGAKDYPKIENFNEKILKVIKLKLDSRKEDIINIKLPLTHYYCYGDKVIYPNGSEFIIEFIEKYIADEKV